MPLLSDAEKVQLTRIYSAYGALERDGMAVTRRPMRPVHHTASKPARADIAARLLEVKYP